MSLGTTLRVGFALLGLSIAGACAQRELDKKPELAQEHGYFVSQTDAEARGGVGNYIDVPSNSERARLDEQRQQAGEAAQETTIGAGATAAVAPPPEPVKVDTVAILKDEPKTVLFDLGDSAIKEESKPILDEIATQMKDAGDAKVKVEGHADKLGTPEGNRVLSQERAENVRDYLESKGAPSEQLDVAFYGDEQASSPNANPDDRKVVLSLG